MANAPFLETWLESLPLLIETVGTTPFALRLDEALHAFCSFDLSCTFAYRPDGPPALLHDGLKGISSPQIMANYLNGTYVLDAVYDACCRRVPPGLYRLRELAPDDFLEGNYYNSPEVHPCISLETGSLSEEIVFICAAQERPIAYSLLRHKQAPSFSDEEFDRLKSIAPTVLSLLRRQWPDESPPQHALVAPDSSANQIARSFETFACDRLTRREQVIISMILRGHSSLSTARSLGIAEGTVKNHRKHIYSKLGISSQTELFNMFIRHLLS